jgi:hypothetical protein
MNLPLILLGGGFLAVAWMAHRSGTTPVQQFDANTQNNAYEGTRGVTIDGSGTNSAPILDPSLVNYATGNDLLWFNGVSQTPPPRGAPDTANPSPQDAFGASSPQTASPGASPVDSLVDRVSFGSPSRALSV